MKKIILTILLIFMPILVFAKGDITVNKSSLTIEEGSSTTFTVTANNSAGKITFTSDDKTVATVNKSSEWVEKETLTVKVTGVSVGSTTIKVNINASTFDEEVIKTTKTITVNVTAKKSSNANLSDLKIDGTTLSGFSSSKTSYSYSTENNSVVLSATTEDSKAKVSGTGTKTLKYGSNKYTIKVTAENGSTKSYIVTVNKKDDRNSNNNLKSLSINVGNINFNKNTLTYNIEVENNVKEVTINAESEQAKSKISGTGTRTLKEGNNEFKIIVTAENETTKTYTIKINRKSNSTNPNDEPKEVEKKKYTIKYDSESYKYCSNSYLSNITIEEGNKIGDLCTPIRDGYEFNGWYTEKEFGEQINEDTIANNDLILYAHWNKINTSIKFNLILLIVIGLLSFTIGFITAYFILKSRYIKYSY